MVVIFDVKYSSMSSFARRLAFEIWPKSAIIVA
jgi:hypothetical protein